ncbi:hypothetical protein GGI22_006886 [Coemansia erecta]|nr:hypothetical protein GGI22_006886 [Coemansia erecta]
MKTTYALALAALGFLATSSNAVPVEYASTTEGSHTGDAPTAGSGPHTGTIMIYDVEPLCPVDTSNTLPLVGISENLFNENMCNKCVSIQDGANTLLALIAGIAEGYGENNLGMDTSEIASLNGDGYGQFTHDTLNWTIVDCNQSTQSAK